MKKNLYINIKNNFGLYKKALEKSLKRKVDEVYIYSLYLEKELDINIE